jgi:hypothetical protein
MPCWTLTADGSGISAGERSGSRRIGRKTGAPIPGHWGYTEEWGWYWISADDEQDWGWVVFHYGRWVFDAQLGWIWIPRAEWGPGWVDWRRGQHRGEHHIGWAPLPPEEVLVEVERRPEVWIFIRARDFTAPRIREVVVERREYEVLIRETVVVNRTIIVDERERIAVNPGIEPEYVAAAVGRPLHPIEVRPPVLAGTVSLPNAVEVRANERQRVRETVVEKQQAVIQPAQNAPPPTALRPGEKARLGEHPLAAAHQAQQPGQPSAPGTAGQRQPGAPAETRREQPGKPSTAQEPQRPGAPGTAQQPARAGTPGTAQQPQRPGAPSTAQQPQRPGAPSTAEERKQPGTPEERQRGGAERQPGAAPEQRGEAAKQQGVKPDAEKPRSRKAEQPVANNPARSMARPRRRVSSKTPQNRRAANRARPTSIAARLRVRHPDARGNAGGPSNAVLRMRTSAVARPELNNSSTGEPSSAPGRARPSNNVHGPNNGRAPTRPSSVADRGRARKEGAVQVPRTSGSPPRRVTRRNDSRPRRATCRSAADLPGMAAPEWRRSREAQAGRPERLRSRGARVAQLRTTGRRAVQIPLSGAPNAGLCSL